MISETAVVFVEYSFFCHQLERDLLIYRESFAMAGVVVCPSAYQLVSSSLFQFCTNVSFVWIHKEWCFGGLFFSLVWIHREWCFGGLFVSLVWIHKERCFGVCGIADASLRQTSGVVKA